MAKLERQLPDGKLTVWNGSVEVQPIQAQNTNSETFKFDTCKHRSEKEEEYTHRTCCSTTQRFAYRCGKLNKIPLPAAKCVGCPHYEAKS